MGCNLFSNLRSQDNTCSNAYCLFPYYFLILLRFTTVYFDLSSNFILLIFTDMDLVLQVNYAANLKNIQLIILCCDLRFT